MTVWVSALGAALLVALLSLVGAVAMLLPKKHLERSLTYLVSLAVGVLLGNAFIHLLPEAIAGTKSPTLVSSLTLLGIVLFFVLEKVVQWRHEHLLADVTTRPLAQMNLIGDAAHNFIDGVIIASSFLVAPAAGWATTLAIIAHEIPQEIGDMGTLVYGGYTPRRAAWLNFLCALTAAPGAFCALLFGALVNDGVVYLLPVAAGGFIYVAASDLIPELHREPQLRRQIGQSVSICLGIGAMFLVIAFESLLR
jgi:zinc and cadmium transporter